MSENGNTTVPSNGAKAESVLAQHLRELSAEVEGLKAAGRESLTDMLAHWLAAHYTAAAGKVADERNLWTAGKGPGWNLRGNPRGNRKGHARLVNHESAPDPA